MTNNDLQSNDENTQNRETPISRKTDSELRRSGKVSNSCSTCDNRRVTLVNNTLTCHEEWIGLW